MTSMSAVHLYSRNSFADVVSVNIAATTQARGDPSIIADVDDAIKGHLEELKRKAPDDSKKAKEHRKTLLSELRELTNLRREIVGCDEGSVVFIIACPSVRALEDLRALCEDESFAANLANAHEIENILQSHNATEISFTTTMDLYEYYRCGKYLMDQAERSEMEVKINLP